MISRPPCWCRKHETAAMLLLQTSPVRVEPLSYVRLCSDYTGLVFVPTPTTELSSIVRTATAQNWNWAVGRIGYSELIPILTPEYLLPSQRLPVLPPTYSLRLRSEYLFTLRQIVARNIFEIGEEQLRFVTEIGPKSPFLCVNQCWIQTFR